MIFTHNKKHNVRLQSVKRKSRLIKRKLWNRTWGLIYESRALFVKQQYIKFLCTFRYPMLKENPQSTRIWSYRSVGKRNERRWKLFTGKTNFTACMATPRIILLSFIHYFFCPLRLRDGHNSLALGPWFKQGQDLFVVSLSPSRSSTDSAQIFANSSRNGYTCDLLLYWSLLSVYFT